MKSLLNLLRKYESDGNKDIVLFVYSDGSGMAVSMTAKENKAFLKLFYGYSKCKRLFEMGVNLKVIGEIK